MYKFCDVKGQSWWAIVCWFGFPGLAMSLGIRQQFTKLYSPNTPSGLWISTTTSQPAKEVFHFSKQINMCLHSHFDSSCQDILGICLASHVYIWYPLSPYSLGYIYKHNSGSNYGGSKSGNISMNLQFARRPSNTQLEKREDELDLNSQPQQWW